MVARLSIGWCIRVSVLCVPKGENESAKSTQRCAAVRFRLLELAWLVRQRAVALPEEGIEEDSLGLGAFDSYTDMETSV